MSTQQAHIRCIQELPGALQDSMFALYERYYTATSRQLFLEDLHNKDWVILLTDSQERLVGFSTLAILSFEFNGMPYRAIFSGDTIIAHTHWGEPALAFSWLRFAGRLKSEQPAVPLYWFLIVKGHRTYRFLPAFSLRYYPHWQQPTPPGEQALLDHLAKRRFGDAYDSQRGLVRFPVSRGQLKSPWAVIPPDDLRKPEVRFFLERNPGYIHGDEWVCLTELHPDNLRPLARRLFLQGLQG